MFGGFFFGLLATGTAWIVFSDPPPAPSSSYTWLTCPVQQETKSDTQCDYNKGDSIGQTADGTPVYQNPPYSLDCTDGKHYQYGWVTPPTDTLVSPSIPYLESYVWQP